MLQFASKKFDYNGSLDDSKSIVNRLLVIQSHYKNLKLDFRSDADDVLFLQRALFNLDAGHTEFEIGSGGTSLRFFLGRLSRNAGRYVIKAHARLLSRPHDDLYKALYQLGTLVLKKNDQTLHVISKGWESTDTVFVKSDISSQFFSSIILNSWNLKKPLKITFGTEVASQSFLRLTKSICQRLGMYIQSESDHIVIPPKQTVNVKKLKAEVDASSTFTLACFALLFGHLKVRPFKNEFGQPDFNFLNLFDEWKINYKIRSDFFELSKQELPKFVELNIESCPDLFPVLCAMLSFSDGMHKIYGAPNLASKESDRIAKTYELLNLAGIAVTKLADGIILQGMSNPPMRKFSFNPDNDHRMAFAASIFAYAGYEVDLLNCEVVSKSFPQFWEILGFTRD